MGNVLEHASSVAIEDADVIEEDLKWLGVKGSMMFNDDFLEEEYTNLPHYDGTEMLPEPGGDGSPGLSGEDTAGTIAGGFHGGSGGQDAVRRMLQLLGPQHERSGGGGAAAGTDATGSGAGTGVGTSVEDFPPLLGESYLRASTHSTATRMRSRLFQRMHLALMRQAYRAMTSLAAEAGGKAGALALTATSTFALPPSSTAEERGESDPAAILTSASMRMSLTLMGALRATVPGLFTSMAQTLMDLFGASAPFALRQVDSSSAYLETLAQVREVAQRVATADSGSPEEERAQAVALLLSLGVATGCVSDVIRVAKLLLDKDAPALPPSAGSSVKRLRDHSTPPKVTLPKPNTWTASFSARLETETDGGSGSEPHAAAQGGLGGGSAGRDDAAAAGGGCCNPATDGVYVYVWDAGSKGVHKVGTGFHGTLAGNVYCSSTKILDDIRAFKGMQPVIEAEEDDQDGAGQGDAGRSASQAGTSEAFNLFTVPPSRRSGGDGGVIISDAAAQRRRSLMGTGLNIGGGEMSDSVVYNSGDSSDDNSSSFGEGGSFHTSNFEVTGVSRFGLPSSFALSSSASSASSSFASLPPTAPTPVARGPIPVPPPLPPGAAAAAAAAATATASGIRATVPGRRGNTAVRSSSSASQQSPSQRRRTGAAGGVRLHRVPSPLGPGRLSTNAGLSPPPLPGAPRPPAMAAGGAPVAATAGGARASVERPSRSASGSPPRGAGTRDAILGAMGTIRAREREGVTRIGVAVAVGAGAAASLRVGGGSDGGREARGGNGGDGESGNGLLRFRALEDITLVDRVPESGFPGEDQSGSGQTMQEDDEGDILECKVVHGFRWYRVRVTTRAASTQSLNIVGWVPLQGLDSDAGSWYGSEEAAELDGEEYIEILDPTTGEIIMPDSPRALRPPVWDEARDATFAAVQGFLAGFDGSRRDSRVSRGGGGGIPGGGGGSGGESRPVVRPVWLACAAGKLFLREKASGALAADEIAVLGLSDLSLEGVVGLTDLPVPGFPDYRSPDATTGDGIVLEGEGKGATVAGGGGGDEKEEPEEKEEKEEKEEEGDEEEVEEVFMGFAYTDLGAFVTECSSNSETSGGMLQNNLLVREASDRLPFPSSSSLVALPTDVAFSFADSDRDRVIVVDLGRARRVREAGVELMPSPGVDVVRGAMSSLLVETSLNGDTWNALGSWPSPTEPRSPDDDGEDSADEFIAMVTAGADSEHLARLVRYTLAPPSNQSGAPIPPCWLTRLLASGPSKAVPEGLEGFGLEEDQKNDVPFPAMTTDSRHIILVHAAGGEREGKKEDSEEAEAAAAVTLGEPSPRRLDVFFLDPEDGYRLVKTATVAWDLCEVELHRNALLCDGDRLVALTHKDSAVVKRTADTAVVAMRCRSSVFLEPGGGEGEGNDAKNVEEDMEFDVRSAGGLAPTGLGYDRRNNIMWGWDAVLKKLCRWRDDGLPPVFAPPRPATSWRSQAPLPPGDEGVRSQEWKSAPKSQDFATGAALPSGGKEPDPVRQQQQQQQRVGWTRDMLSSASPSHRVEGLQEAGLLIAKDADDVGGDRPTLRARCQAALLLGHLERLGEPYSPPEEAVAEPRVRCELEAASGGKDDGNFSRLLVRGEDKSCKEPGINVLVLTETLDAGGDDAKGFATHESLHAANRLADYLNAVPPGRTVLIAVQEDAAGNLNNSARKALLSVGAGAEEVAALGTHRRSSFAMVGRKGSKPGSVPQVLRLPKKGCATIRQRLPAPRVPMCVDVSKETLHGLVELVLQHESLLLQTKQPQTSAGHERDGGSAIIGAGGVDGGGVGQAELDAAVVLSAVNILTNHMFQLIRGSSPAVALASFSPDHVGPLLDLLIAVIDQDRPATATEPRQSPPASSPSSSHKRNAANDHGGGRKTRAPTPSATPPSATDADNAVRRVSCKGTGGRTTLSSGDVSGGEERGAVAATVAGAEARRGMLQRACLRLFVTGMDLFFPSCAQRCSLLARYLSKYLSDGLSPARQTVLELLLRRMSDPSQLVELVSHIPPSSDPAASAAGASAANPFVIPTTATPTAAVAVVSPAMGEAVSSSAGADVAKTATGMVAGPAPSAIELQCLLLSVATAEGVSKIKALQRQESGGATAGGGGGEGADCGGDSGRGGTKDGAVQGGVGEAAVEMLERLTNQLLSSAACVIMESDVDALSDDVEEEIDSFLKAIGVAALPSAPAGVDNASTNPATASNAPAPNLSDGGRNTPLGLDSAAATQAEAAGSVERLWVGTDVSAASTLVVLVTALCRSCTKLAFQAVETADAIGERSKDGCGTLPKEVDRVLQASPLGALLPMLASSLTLLVDKHGVKIQGRLSAMAREIVGVMSITSKVLARVPRDRLTVAGVSKSVGTVTKSVVMESKHNYEALTNEIFFLEIAGAAKMMVTFDERSRTEDSYDYLVFWKDESKTESWHPHIAKLSGSGGSCNFPGFGGRPPLVIESDRCWIEWRTDGSNEDWGWKFTATAEIKKVATGGDGGGYWLLGLDRQLAGAGAALAGCLVISKPWGGKAEDDNAPWMEDALLAGAVSPEAAAAAVVPSPMAGSGSAATALPPQSTAFPETATTTTTTATPGGAAWEGSATFKVAAAAAGAAGGAVGGDLAAAGNAPQPCPELVMLLEMVDRLEGTNGIALCKVMRTRVGEDQGSVEAVNRAVYATCAALIWHQGLGAEALALAEGRVAAPSKALSKTWRFGQQMRQYFDYGDVREAINSQMELQRKQAVTMESSWRSSNSLSVDDATPSTRPILTRGPSVYQGAEEKVIAEVSERIVSRALFLLSLPSQATRVSLQEQSKRRWSILARLGGVGVMPRTPSQSNHLGDGAELLDKWKEVVDEATAMRKLKSILLYRRKAADMRERAKENSVSERIMRFAQCPTDVSELEMVRQCRDQRAKLRAEGLRLTRALVAAAASPPAKAWLLSSHAQSIRLTKREDRPGAHVHYLSSVEGCEPSAYLALARQFALLVKSSLETLQGCSRPAKGETPSQAVERRALAVSSLQALALDYDLGDHEILKESILLEVLEPLLQGFNEATGGQAEGADCGAATSTGGDGSPDGLSEPLRGETSAGGADGGTAKGNSGGGGSSGDGGDDENGSDDDEEYFDTGSIGDDIAALEAELQEEDGLLLDEATGGDGEAGGALSTHPAGGGEESVRKAAWCLFEVLLPRCVGLEGQGLETRLEEPTSFSHRLLAVLIRQVGRASANVQRSNASLGVGATRPSGGHSSNSPSSSPSAPVDLPTSSGGARHDGSAALSPGVGGTAVLLPKETPLLLRGMRLRGDEPGRVAAHRDMSVRHSMSLWLRRDPCPLDAAPGAWYSPPKVGDTVARGPKWPLGDMSDGGPGGLGTVTELTKSNMTAKVQWSITGFQGTYKMGAMSEIPHDADDDSAAPASVDDLLVWEVLRVDPTLGGTVVMKGGVNNLTQEERSEPWSQFGLSLLGNATLEYYAVSGEDQLFSLHSRTMLQPDVWTHVAVVQAKSRCRIYIDGEENGEASLPKHMLTPGGMVKDVLESQHPYANNMDKMWDVRVEGAISYSITFDPLTKTEPTHDYLRFLRGADDLDGECFGEDRYSGGRSGSESNWPGFGGRPPLIINAPSFVVYFHTDQSNNDWGFKMTSAACVSAPEELDEDKNEASTANLNPFPVYLGQPPAYASSQRSASGYLWGASTYAVALTPEQVRRLARAPPPAEPSLMEEEACTDVLSLVQRCALSMDGVVAAQGGSSLSLEAGVSPLVSPQVLGPLLVILLRGSLKLRLAAARLCERLLPQAPLEMVQMQLVRAGLSAHLVPSPSTAGTPGEDAPLVRGLMLKLGETLSVWSRLAAAGALASAGGGGGTGLSNKLTPSLASKESLTSGEEAFALSTAHVGLLRALLARDGWSVPLADCLREACANLPAVTKALEEAGSEEREKGCTEKVAEILCDPKLWMVHACLALLGGNFQGLHVGGRAMALMGDGDGATLERCTVLAMDWPRLHHLAAIEREKSATSSKSANKGADFVCPAKEWEDLRSLGDAVIVCIHSEPDTPRVLPRARVSPDAAAPPASFLSALKSPPFNLQSPLRHGGREQQLSAAAQAAVAAAREEGAPGLIPYVPEGLVEPLVDAFGVLSAADASDKRPRHKPSVVETEEERILESPHPHARGADEVYPLDFPGADSIQLFFDEDCRTEEGTAYIRIYKDDTKTVIWGESMYHGRDKDANWPGLHGRPVVCVPASSCVIKFHSEDRNPDWGFRITAKAQCKSFTLPPERPPLLGPSALSMLQACGAKALVTLVTSWPQFVPRAQPLIKSLAERALGSKSSQEDLKKMAAPQPKKAVLESEHPYTHNADRKETVRIEGAKKLIISFDDRTRTEHGCDYMVFYADDTMTKVYGDSKYTGGKDGSIGNWPGTGGKPALEIPSSMFFFRWQTDGSVNDWGWRMTVTPVMDKMDVATLPPSMLDSKLASLLRICRDCPKEQPPALGLEKFEVDPAASPSPSQGHALVPEGRSPWLPAPPPSPSPSPASSSSSTPVASPWGFFSAHTAAKIGLPVPISAVSRADAAAAGASPPAAQAETAPKIARGLRRFRPRLFVVNPRDAEEVSLRADPRSDSAEIGKVSVNNGQALLVVNERGDWLSVIPIVVPFDAALRHLGEMWDRFSRDQGSYARLGKRTAEGETLTEFNPLNDVKIFDSVVSAARAGPIAANLGNVNDMHVEGIVNEMWALRRQGDMLYLVPHEEASSHLVTLPDEGDPLDIQASLTGGHDSASGASATATAAAFQVLDPPQGDEAGPASRGAFGIHAGAELITEGHRLWSALAETSHATASRFSRLALTRILAGSTGDGPAPSGGDDATSSSSSPPLLLDDFGGPHMFLTLLRATFVEARDSGSDVDAAALEVLKNKILGAVAHSSAEGRQVADMLVAFSLHQLTTAASLAKFLCPTKAVVRTFETAHNYADNTDTYTKVSIPGAKRIRVVFDEKCSTEMGCDFVRIYKDAHHNSYWGEHKYTGPATSRGKVWAGVGGRPPLMVEANTMEVHFHSDASNNDWGVRLSAYGILEEPTAHQRAAYRDKRKEVGDPETELACWLLDALAKEDGDYVKSLLHQRSTMETLARFLEAADNKAKIWVVRLLTSLLLSACPTKNLSSAGAVAGAAATGSGKESLSGVGRLGDMFEPKGPVSVLLDLAVEEAKVEEDRGADARSPLLQALVQACVVADECNKMRGLGDAARDGSGTGAGTSFPEWPRRARTKRSDDNRSIRTEPGCAVDGAPLLAVPGYMAPASAGGAGMIRWHVKVTGLYSSGPRIGVAQPQSLSGNRRVERPPWLLVWDGVGSIQMITPNGKGARLSFGPHVKAGDMVTVEVDALKKAVTFYRNQALVGLAFGPVGSNACIEHGETADSLPWRDGEPLHLAVVLGSTDDAVQVVQPPPPLCPAIASLSPSGNASWWGTGMAAGAGRGSSGGTGAAARSPEWLGCVRESMELMSALLSRELPATFVAKELLPKCQERAAVTLESSHPLGASRTKETVTIRGASSLEVVFDVRTSMGPSDKISVFSKDSREPERVLQGLAGATESSLGSGKSSSGSGSGSGSSGTAVGGISVGDSVVRGPSWNWGEDHDGGPGGYGTVVDIRTWKGRPRSGIKVRWTDTSFVGLYRWDHEGCFDVLVVAHGTTSTKPVVIKGDTLSIQVDPDAVSEPSSARSGSDAAVPRLRLQNGASVLVKLQQSSCRDLLFGDFTVEAWFRIEATPDGSFLSASYPLLSRGIMRGLSQISIKTVSSSDRRKSTVHVDMFAGDLTMGLTLAGGSLTPGRWGHVAFAIDTTGTAKLFVDGVEVASGSFRGPRMLLEDCDLVVGDSLDTEGSLTGHVYDFRLWSRALTAADVAPGLKALPVAGAHGLVANFPFTEGEVTINRGSYSGDIVAVPNLGCALCKSVEPPIEPALSHWGWRCTVTPIYSTENLEEMLELKEELEAFRCLYGSGDVRHDLALVRYVNAFAEKKSFDAQRLLRCSWEDLTPSEEDLVREPLLRELCQWSPPAAATSSASGDAGVEESKGEEGLALAETKEDASGGSKKSSVARRALELLLGKKGGGIAARFEVLQQVNRKLRDALPYFDLTQIDRKWSAAHLLSSCRGLIFRAVKEPVLLSALSDTAFADGGQFDLNLSRSKAARHIHLGHTDTEGRWSVFGQAFRQMHNMHPRGLRTHSKLYNCVFMGERSQDAGGPYRESWSMYAQELQSTALPLLMRTPNGVHAAGVGRDRYVPNPGATSSAQVEMFIFLGKMMGHAMRSKEYLGLNLSVVVWKALVGQEVQLSDLENVDVLLTRSMQDIRTIDQKGVTRAIFSDIVMENFTALSLDDREVELRPGGKNIPVTWDNRLEYADLVEKQRLTECCAMVKHIRKGLSMVVPLAVLGMFNWDEVETLVCGKPEVDVDLLEAIAEYSGCRKEQSHIKLFWQALREFTPHERSMLIKFTWGRTRLPLTAEGFSQRFKLQSFGRSPADDYLPVAHTCFFSLELPAYSSLEVMKERLLFAAFNCSAIDGDDNFAGMNAAALGWDWDEDEEGEDGTQA
eukprot:g2132.t2